MSSMECSALCSRHEEIGEDEKFLNVDLKKTETQMGKQTINEELMKKVNEGRY